MSDQYVIKDDAIGEIQRRLGFSDLVVLGIVENTPNDEFHLIVHKDTDQFEAMMMLLEALQHLISINMSAGEESVH